ncbi:lipid A biosynthesis acyltransferase [Magnetococcus marinus MC-1]|uniref:Lipid A biosynthesis acyltransferase n=1 Tax=Magnetococcus marinus (strain ATCC BAA-1437 / JCM 17883 / MC-1) TaxID=156889 RepID=A0L7W7_MAGMM|nr:lipid A biosynthesis acyltransferase [Magnetococcus marinus]ABK44060.1 lipid A biosynthesis acyltransferase [Magnetococcus marinus MC-1]
MAASPLPLHQRLRHKLEWWTLSTLLNGLQRGTLAQSLARTRRLARLAMPLLASSRHWAECNLQLVYGPNLTAPQRQRLITLAFENIFLSHIEALRASEIHFQATDFTPLQQAMAYDRGILACSMHLGAWEPGLVQMARQPLPLTVLYRHANNPHVEALFGQIRQQNGLHMVRRDHPRPTLQAVKDKQMVGLMVDINTLHHGVAAPFMGVVAQHPPGPIKLARKFAAPLLPMVAVRTAPGVAKLIIQPPIMAQPDESDSQLMTRVVASLEPYILEYAEQYNWLHGRWRARPDGTVWNRYTPLTEILKARTTPYLTPSPRVLELIA